MIGCCRRTTKSYLYSFACVTQVSVDCMMCDLINCIKPDSNPAIIPSKSRFQKILLIVLMLQVDAIEWTALWEAPAFVSRPQYQQQSQVILCKTFAWQCLATTTPISIDKLTNYNNFIQQQKQLSNLSHQEQDHKAVLETRTENNK